VILNDEEIGASAPDCRDEICWGNGVTEGYKGDDNRIHAKMRPQIKKTPTGSAGASCSSLGSLLRLL